MRIPPGSGQGDAGFASAVLNSGEGSVSGLRAVWKDVGDKKRDTLLDPAPSGFGIRDSARTKHSPEAGGLGFLLLNIIWGCVNLGEGPCVAQARGQIAQCESTELLRVVGHSGPSSLLECWTPSGVMR